MISAAVKQLQSAKKDLATKIQGLQAEASKIDTAIAALTGSSVSSAAAKPAKKGSYTRTPAQREAISKAQKAHWAKIRAGKATAAKPAKKQKKMSALGKLRIKLGSLNRYGKKEEAKKVQAQIAAIEAKAAKK